jgi:hypothetical protein
MRKMTKSNRWDFNATKVCGQLHIGGNWAKFLAQGGVVFTHKNLQAADQEGHVCSET